MEKSSVHGCVCSATVQETVLPLDVYVHRQPASGLICYKAACAAPGLVCHKEPKLPLHVCPTAAYAASDVSVLWQPVLYLDLSGTQQPVLPLDMCLSYGSSLYSRRCLACSSLCFTWKYLFNNM
jgi:hypothetical protein